MLQDSDLSSIFHHFKPGAALLNDNNVGLCQEELLKIFPGVRTQDRDKAPISWSDTFCLGGQQRGEGHTWFLFKYCLQSPAHQLITSHGDRVTIVVYHSFD